jgi:YegS/Rv2252/BmrU family lipid kinase
MKTCFIFNPYSGRNLRRPWLAGAIRNFIRTGAHDAGLEITDGPGHATELARSAVATGCEVVVAVGGDGTMNEVAQGLVNTPAALSVVPCGSGNGLALHLGLPRSTMSALQLATTTGARVAAVDTGTANGKPFFNVMGLGLDAEVSRRFNRLRRRGLSAYVRIATASLRALPSQRCTIQSGARSETLDVLLVAIANSDQYGNHARIAPGARVDDGRLDLVAVRSVGLLRAAALVPRLFLGNIDQSADVCRMSGTRFRIVRAGAGLIHTDGETHFTGACVDVVVQRRSLRVLVPASSRAVTSPASAAANRFALQFP